uniref:Uncharacterized protein n=1 Tax=Parascaris equorum TaxID=6256 RepID=A0A914RUG5_PAREQ
MREHFKMTTAMRSGTNHGYRTLRDRVSDFRLTFSQKGKWKNRRLKLASHMLLHIFEYISKQRATNSSHFYIFGNNVFSSEADHCGRPGFKYDHISSPSWAEWELDHSEGNNETRASDGDFVSAIDAIEAFMNTSDSSSENANIHDTSIKISTSTPNFSECSGSSKESVAIVPATSQKKSSRKQARKTKVGNGICPPPPETPSNENWTDPDDIAEFFPKTAQYKGEDFMNQIIDLVVVRFVACNAVEQFIACRAIF